MDKPKCLICKEREVYQIKSHLTPRAISENTYGPKDKEEIYEINPQTGQHDVFKGREHPEAVPDDIKPQPNVEKGIFCKKCEEALGRLESLCQPVLLEIVQKLPQGLYKVEIVNGLKIIKVQIPSNVLNLFLLSIIWRQGLEQERAGNDNPFSKDEFEHLRVILNDEIHKTIDDIGSCGTFSAYPEVLLFTTYFHGKYNGFNNPHPIMSNPEIFFISEFVCLYWRPKAISNKLEELTGLPASLHKPLQLIGSKESIIAIINQGVFNKIIAGLTGNVAQNYIFTHIKKVAEARQLSIYRAEVLLKITAARFSGPNPSPELYHKCLLEASRQLTSK